MPEEKDQGDNDLPEREEEKLRIEKGYFKLLKERGHRKLNI